MAITIVDQPDDWNLNRNGVGWKLSTDNEYSVAGVAGVADVSWTLPNYPADGEQFTISWNAGADSLTFTFRTTPGENGDEVPLVTTSPSDFLAALKSGLDRNWQFTSLFKITVTAIGGDRSIITALTKGTRYTPSFSESTASTVSVTTTNGVDAERRVNFKLLLKLNMWNTATPAVILSKVNEAVPVNGQADFDVSDALDSAIGVNNIPADDADFVNFTSSMVQFSAVWAEKYGDPVIVRRLSQAASYVALIGGWHKNRIATDNFYAQVDAGIFLTNLTERRISPTQPEFLHYISPGSLVSSHAELFYSDGSSVVVDILTSPTSASNALWCIPMNWGLIDALRDPELELLYWEVFLSNEDPGNPITNRIRYELKDEYQLDSTILLFRNSYGVYEVFDCPGEVSHSTDVSRVDSTRILNRGFSATDSGVVTVRSSYRPKRQLSTGFVSKEEADWLQELANTDLLYEFDGENHFPLGLEFDSFPRYSTESDEVNTFNFTIKSDTNETGR